MRASILAAAAACIAVSDLAPAQSDEPMPLTWVRYFTVKPGHADEFHKMIMEHDAPVFDGMIESGDAITWGLMSPFTRTGQDWTHAIWVTSPSWESYDALMAGFMEAEAERSDAENKKMEKEFMGVVDPTSIHDTVLRHVKLIDADRDDPEPRYIRFGFYKIKPGHEGEIADLYESWAGPVFTELDEDDVVNAAGLARQEIVADGDWTHVSWAIMPRLGSMDRVDAAFQAAEKERSPGEQEKIQQTAMEAMDMEAYRSSICIVTHFKKAGG